MAASAPLALPDRTRKPDSPHDSPLDDVVRRRINTCAYRGNFHYVRWSIDGEKLILTGRVPSFYLKQVLQTLLRDIQDVRQIDNRVEVVSANGSSRPRSP
jgi:hypothetical protein